jgi:hypothetical protein
MGYPFDSDSFHEISIPSCYRPDEVQRFQQAYFKNNFGFNSRSEGILRWKLEWGYQRRYQAIITR